MLNINADTVAGKLSEAMNASKMVFLTDVMGVLDSSNRLMSRLTERQALTLVRSKVIAGGMIPKIEACLSAVKAGGSSYIVDGREPRALDRVVSGHTLGTRIG
jgi:acetylglutamate kinase